jgi:hypothetical protein
LGGIAGKISKWQHNDGEMCHFGRFHSSPGKYVPTGSDGQNEEGDNPGAYRAKDQRPFGAGFA